MSSSSEAPVVQAGSREGSADAVDPAPLSVPQLRTGVWTRFGGSTVLGDPVTEQLLETLAESTRTAARSQGYAIGWAEGRRAARDAADAEAAAVEAARIEAEAVRAHEHELAVTALELAAARLHETVAGLCATIEDHASALAWELTHELVGHELRTVTGADVVRRALQLTPTEPIVRVHLHPDQALELDEVEAERLAVHGAAVVADPTLAWGDALVETDDHVVDLRVRTALDRVRDVLSGGAA